MGERIQKTILERSNLDSNFFLSILDPLMKESEKKVTVIIVAHILYDSIALVDTLKKIFSKVIVLAKPKSINKAYFDHIKKSTTIEIAERSNFNTIAFLVQYLDQDSNNFLLIDIGGYFSDIANDLVMAYGKRFLGVVEDTENGLQKYEKTKIDYPFYHVARSPLKDGEDYLVGQAISFSAEAILRENNILLNGKNVGIIGFGKIGSSIAYGLKSKHSIVSIYDKNPIKAISAYSRGFLLKAKVKLCRESDIVCLATGNKALEREDFEHLKSGSILFTVTSSDDEIDLLHIKHNYKKQKITKHIDRYEKNGKHFYLLNNGNAINFIHGTTVSDFILLVHAEIIRCSQLLTKRISSKGNKLDETSRVLIAKKWITHYNKTYD